LPLERPLLDGLRLQICFRPKDIDIVKESYPVYHIVVLIESEKPQNDFK